MHSDLEDVKTKAEAEKISLSNRKIKSDFPIFEREVNGHKLVYLDSAATTQKPQAVIDALVDYYRNYNSNIHRGLHTLSEEATSAHEKTRDHVAEFIGGVNNREIVFTRGATEAINLIAYSWGEQNIGEDDEIIITEMEHHANFVPWVMLARRKKAVIRRLPIAPYGYLETNKLKEIINSRTRLIAVTHVSNVLGTINPVAEIAEAARRSGAMIVVDGAQAAPHMQIDVKKIGADFYVFSGHKMLGPTGVGVLYGREELLAKMPPFNMGGEMIEKVGFDNITWAELPYKFEAGTPAIGDIIAFDTALTYLEDFGMDRIRVHEKELTAYAIEKLLSIPGIEIQGPLDPNYRGGAISFTDPTIHPHDISTFLDSRGIAIRAGHHCAQPLMQALGKVATARASLYIYNDVADIDALYDALLEMRRFFEHESRT
jgi:cysteine desulfurase/selenocysteine lyase